MLRLYAMNQLTKRNTPADELRGSVPIGDFSGVTPRQLRCGDSGRAGRNSARASGYHLRVVCILIGEHGNTNWVGVARSGGGLHTGAGANRIARHGGEAGGVDAARSWSGASLCRLIQCWIARSGLGSSGGRCSPSGRCRRDSTTNRSGSCWSPAIARE